MVVYHDFDIAEDLAVPPVGLVASLRHAGQALPVEGAMGLRVEHEGHGQQALDPFCVGQPCPERAICRNQNTNELVAPVSLEGIWRWVGLVSHATDTTPKGGTPRRDGVHSTRYRVVMMRDRRGQRWRVRDKEGQAKQDKGLRIQR